MLYYGNTDVGMKRLINQDNFKTIPVWGGEATLLVVCDGMGGHKAGDVASKTAINTFCEEVFKHIPTETNEAVLMNQIRFILSEALDKANEAVYKMAHEDTDCEGMGTTLIGALVRNGQLYGLNVGDSRMYLLTKNVILQLSKDHSYVQYLIDCGKLTPEEAKTYPRKNVITNAIGVGPVAVYDSIMLNLNDWDTGYLLLCSDGLSNYADNDTLMDIISKPELDHEETEVDLMDKVTKLISHANNCGGADNITAVVAKF